MLANGTRWHSRITRNGSVVEDLRVRESRHFEKSRKVLNGSDQPFRLDFFLQVNADVRLTRSFNGTRRWYIPQRYCRISINSAISLPYFTQPKTDPEIDSCRIVSRCERLTRKECGKGRKREKTSSSSLCFVLSGADLNRVVGTAGWNDQRKDH